MANRPNPLDFCRSYLKKRPQAPFAEIRDAAKKKRIVRYPISYGRAKALEGVVMTAPYGSKKKAAKKTVAKRRPGRPKGSKNKPKRGPGRLRKNTAGNSPVDELVAMVKELQRERDQALATLERVRAALP